MPFLSWLQNRIPTSTHKRRRTHVATRKQGCFRPLLETLEGRDVPSTLTVTNNLDTGVAGDGSLRGEIAAAHSNDTIVFAPSLDGQVITLTGSELDITKNLTIQGPGAGELTVSGGYFLRVFEVAAKVTVSGLTISEGAGRFGAGPHDVNYDGFGGGVLNHGTLTISGCTLAGNGALEGGGIFNDHGATLTVTGCTVTGNGAYEGGGIFNMAQAASLWHGGKATISNSTLSNNTATSGDMGSGIGGGIYNGYGAKMTVSSCTLFGNIDGSSYDAIYNEGLAGTLTVSNCTFYSNYIRGPYTDGGGNTFI